ncbi:Rid family hydrolase [Halobium salinum]|uniref:Rid family hydrolase n=1 Tax=Halobium salinum TaxID=1364940 RepID=A0ABD5PI01_9EURY|nr:Rid family hydrolase [Halobium salinum]
MTTGDYLPLTPIYRPPFTDLDDYGRVNGAYGGAFDGEPPARVCAKASRLPDDVPVEVDAVAYPGRRRRLRGRRP